MMFMYHKSHGSGGEKNFRQKTGRSDLIHARARMSEAPAGKLKGVRERRETAGTKYYLDGEAADRGDRGLIRSVSMSPIRFHVPFWPNIVH